MDTQIFELIFFKTNIFEPKFCYVFFRLQPKYNYKINAIFICFDNIDINLVDIQKLIVHCW